MTTAAAMPTIMLPATEKLSTQAFCFFSARYKSTRLNSSHSV